MFKTGNPGKPKGATNKTTRETRELIEQIVLDELSNIKQLLNELEPSERAYVICKLLPYVLPKPKDEPAGEMIIKIVDDSTSPYNPDKY
jgi:hypothetical protein